VIEVFGFLRFHCFGISFWHIFRKVLSVGRSSPRFLGLNCGTIQSFRGAVNGFGGRCVAYVEQ